MKVQPTKVLSFLVIVVASLSLIGLLDLTWNAAASRSSGSLSRFPEATYTIEELPTSGSWVYHDGSIDITGRIAYSVDAHAFLRSGRKQFQLKERPSWISSFALAMDGAGNSVGYSENQDHSFEAVIWRGSQPALLRNLPGYACSVATGVNSLGQVVGRASAMPSDSTEWWSVPSHAVLWEKGDIYDLGLPPGCVISRAYGINTAGTVVGWSITKHWRMHACVWERSTGMRDLGTLLGGTVSKAVAVNNHMQIIGDADDAKGRLHTVLWQNGKMVDLGFPPSSGGWCCPKAINDNGVIVGDTHRDYRPDGAIFVWDHANGMRMVCLPDDCRFRLQRAIDIGPDGRILAAGVGDNPKEPYDHRLFVLTPLTSQANTTM